jgi:hypothetical protein
MERLAQAAARATTDLDSILKSESRIELVEQP